MSRPGALDEGSGLGALGLAGPLIQQNFSLPTFSKTAKPYIVHLYDRNLVFKRTFGGSATLIDKTGLKLTQNGGFQAITLKMTGPVPGIVLGDVIRLSEQGDNSGTILFSGNVETTPVEQLPGSINYLITVTPWVAELGDGYFDQNYSTATDVAQFVRDAVAKTAHCSVSPISCPNSGVTAIYDFQNTNPLDAVHVAKQIAGANFWWWCDAQGVVWFQTVDTTIPPTLTLKKGVDYNRSKPVSTIAGMKNKIVANGGQNPGDPGRISATYDGLTNQGLYGIRAFNPSLAYPQVTDQGTLQAIVNSLGAQLDKVQTQVEVDCLPLGQRLILGRPGGLTVRLLEPAISPLIESGEPFSGAYTPVYIVQDVEVTGAKQKILIGNAPYSDTDPAYEVARIGQRISAVASTALPTPPLMPQPPPPTTVIYGAVHSSTGIFTEGGGVVTIATATFTTPLTGVCQVIGAVDARMEAWDNYVSAPRRAVRATLSSGVFTGSWQELPFGLTRATYDLSSPSGLSLPAGTYTVVIQIDTVEFNQIHVYSGYVQVAVTA